MLQEIYLHTYNFELHTHTVRTHAHKHARKHELMLSFQDLGAMEPSRLPLGFKLRPGWVGVAMCTTVMVYKTSGKRFHHRVDPQDAVGSACGQSSTTPLENSYVVGLAAHLHHTVSQPTTCPVTCFDLCPSLRSEHHTK